MSCATQESSPPQQDRTALQKAVDWVAKFWPRVRLGHEAWMLDKINRQQRIVEVTARNTMTGNMQDTKGLPINEEGDDMGVSIGDHIVNHYYPAASPQEPTAGEPPTPPAASPQEPTPAKSIVSKLAPYLIAAALGGTGVGGTLLGQWLAKPTQPPAVTDTDTTRRAEIGVWRPGE